MESYYPRLQAEELLPVKVAIEQLEADPLWLDRKGCPYDEETVEAMRALWLAVRQRRAPAVEEVEEADQEPGNRWDKLISTIDGLMHDMEDIRREMGDPKNAEIDIRERLAYFKAASSIVERMVSFGERAANVRAVSKFQARVLTVFDQVLSPDQRTAATELMGAGIEG